MKSKKSVIICCALAVMILLLLTAFSENGEIGETAQADGSTVSTETSGAEAENPETGETVPAETQAPTEETVPAETQAPTEEMQIQTEASAGETQTQTDASAGETQTQTEASAEETQTETLAGEGSTASKNAVPAVALAQPGTENRTEEAGQYQEEAGQSQESEDSTDGAAEAAADPAEAALAQDETLVLAAEDLKKEYTEGIFLITVTGNTALNIREEPTTESDWVGKMYEGSGGQVLEAGDGWTKIQSGKVTGWVSNDYILTGEEAAAELMQNYELIFEVTSDALKVRSEPTTEEDNKIRAIYGGETYEVISVQQDWVQIEYSKEKYGWVAAEYGTIHYEYDDAMTKKQYQDYVNSKKHKNVSTTTRSATSASTDDLTLLACLIQCESGSYEGMLAVANVVINRVNSSRYPNSISGVIYAPGQFSPASSGKLDTRLAKGPSATAVQAATDALNGTNNIGSYVHFRSGKTADVSQYSSYTIVGGNVFY